MLTKYAAAEILDVKGSAEQVERPTLEKLADFEDYKTDDGYLYTRVRAISSRVNKNNDGWPAEELQKSYLTFMGKPIFVDHHNSNPKKARGVIVDSKIHIEDDLDKASAFDPYYATAPDNHKPPTWVELLLEVDAKAFPRLAKAIVSGDIDSVSMGCNVERSQCNICSNWATAPSEYCEHIQLKGAHFDSEDDHGQHTSKRSYEDCYDIGFFEISYVFDPADETALVHEVRSSKIATARAVHAEAGDDLSDEDLERYEQEQRELDKTRPPLVEHDDLLKRFRQQLDEGSTGLLPNVQDEANRALAEERHSDPAAFGEAASDALRENGHDPEQIQREMQDRWMPGAIQKRREEYNQRSLDDQLNQIRGLPETPSTLDRFHQYLLQNRQMTPEDILHQGHCASCGSDLDADACPLGHTSAYGDPHESVPDPSSGLLTDPPAHAYQPPVIDHEAPDPRRPWLIYGPSGAEYYATEQEAAMEQSNHLSHKTADNPLPQSMKPHAPDHINTLRHERICQACGSEMEDGKCDVCGYEEPPEGFNNPDLDKARQMQQEQVAEGEAAAQTGAPPDGGGGPPPGQGAGPPPGQQMASSTTISANPNHLTNEGKLAAKTPQKIERPILAPKRIPSDLPVKTKVTQDQRKPVESHTNPESENAMNYTAAQVKSFAHKLVMEGHAKDYDTALAMVTSAITKEAEGATPVASDVAADQRVNVNDVGGFDNVDLNNWADQQVDPEGVGGFDDNPEAGTDHQDVTKAVDTSGSGPTKTWSGTEDQHSPVTPETGDFFTVSKDKKANLFPDDDNFGKQIDVEKPLMPEGVVGPETETWSKPEANGHAFADPVTKEVFPGITVSKAMAESLQMFVDERTASARKEARSHLLAALRVAESEIELGLTQEEDKFNRLQELDKETPEELKAHLDSYARMKTAGATTKSKRVATLKAPRLASVPSTETPRDSVTEDAAMFM